MSDCKATALDFIYHDGVDYKPGDEIVLPKQLYDLWIEAGLVRAIQHETKSTAKAK